MRTERQSESPPQPHRPGQIDQDVFLKIVVVSPLDVFGSVSSYVLYGHVWGRSQDALGPRLDKAGCIWAWLTRSSKLFGVEFVDQIPRACGGVFLSMYYSLYQSLPSHLQALVKMPDDNTEPKADRKRRSHDEDPDHPHKHKHSQSRSRSRSPRPDRDRPRHRDRDDNSRTKRTKDTGFKWKDKSRDQDRSRRDGNDRDQGGLQRGYKDHYRPRSRSPKVAEEKSTSGGKPLSQANEPPAPERKEKKSKSDKPPAAAPIAQSSEAMIIVYVNDRLGTKKAVPCFASDSVKDFKTIVASLIGRRPHEILLKRQGERPFKDILTLRDYGVSNNVQLDLEVDTGD